MAGRWCRPAGRWPRPAGTAGLGHDEGRRSGGGVEDFRGKKSAAEKTQVGPNFNFLGVEYYVLLEMNFFFHQILF